MYQSQGKNKSIWSATSPHLSLPALKESLKTDVCIIGAGITGLTTAYLLAKAGKKVVVIDRDFIGGGDTGWTTAHITKVLDLRFHELKKLHGEAGAQAAMQSHQAAIDKIESIIGKEKIDCDFSRLDGYLFLAPNESRESLERELQELHKLGEQDAEISQHKIQGIDLGISLKFPDQAQFHPLKYLNGLAKSIQSHGGEIYEKTFVEDIQENSHGVQVRLKNNLLIDCHAAVVATNAPFNDRFKMHTKQSAYQTYVIALKIPQDSVAKGLYWDTAEPYHYIRTYSSPDLNHDLLIVGGEDHRTGQGENTEKHFQKLIAWTQKKFPHAGQVSYQWSGQILEPIDGLAYIGLNPGNKHIYIGTGYSGNGMTSGTIAAIINSDLILHKTNQWAELYNPARKNLHAFGKFLLVLFNISKRIFLDIFLPPAAATNLKKDSGTVISDGLKRTAVYKDANGKLCKYSAVCPHLGCIVDWNGAEKTWDCPCHGSRFDAHGKVIKGPANTNLPKEE